MISDGINHFKRIQPEFRTLNTTTEDNTWRKFWLASDTSDPMTNTWWQSMINLRNVMKGETYETWNLWNV